jgi:hypothetical protein
MWYGVLALFAFQALWLVLSMIYPGVFDEGVHFETIKLYATQWSPFFDSQALANDYLGQIIGQTSFLFYWVFSFIYRLLEALGLSDIGIILMLRFINIGFFGYGLIIGRKLLREVNVSRAASSLALFVFVMIPIVPQLAAQINYDNVLFLLVNISLLLAVRIIKIVHEKNKIPLRELLSWLTVGLTASIVKVAFLPIFAASGLVLFGWLILQQKQSKSLFVGLKQQLKITGWRDYALIAAFALVGLLFVVRYGGNVINYGQLQPSCDAVLSEQRCRAFGPYGRDYRLNQNLSDNFEPNSTQYAVDWYRGMHKRLLFTINGNTAVDTYQNFPPLPIVSTTVHVISIVGLGFVLMTLPRRLRNPTDILFISMVVLYVGILIVRNYTGSYLSTGQMVAINGRYLLLVLLPAMAVVLRAASEVLRGRAAVKSALATLIILGMIQGGGISGFMIRSSDTWWWDVPEVSTINRSVGEIVNPLIIGD